MNQPYIREKQVPELLASKLKPSSLHRDVLGIFAREIHEADHHLSMFLIVSPSSILGGNMNNPQNEIQSNEQPATMQNQKTNEQP